MPIDKVNEKLLSAIDKVQGINDSAIEKINGQTFGEATPTVHSPLWVAVGGNKLAYSTDATPTGSWTEVSLAGVFSFKDLTFGKNGSGTDTWYGCSTSDSKAVGYSTDPTDAASWTVVNPPGSGGGTTIEYGATETLIMGREHENYTIRRSTDFGVNWSDTTIQTGAGNSKASDSLATDGDGVWLAGMGSLGIILKSFDDGINWYKSADLGNDKHIGLEYANGVWVATEQGETINICTDVGEDTATDSWTAISPPVWARAADSITHVTGSTWMLGAARRNIYKSTDNAASWTDVTKLDNPAATSAQTNNNPYSMASDGTSVVAVGRNGYINVSTNLGSTWTIAHTMSSNQSLVAVEYNKVKPF